MGTGIIASAGQKCVRDPPAVRFPELRFLFLNQFYPPDVAPTGRLLRDVAQTLAERGHQTRVLCSKKAYAAASPGAPDLPGGPVDVRRMPGLPAARRSLVVRAFDDALFLLTAGLAILVGRTRPDVIVAASSPPLLGLVTALVARVRRIPYVLWTMDVYPEALQAEWPWARSGPVASVLRLVARLQSGRSALIVTLGEDMANRVRPHARTASAVQVVPIWSDVASADDDATLAQRKERGWSPTELVLMYSGNMGRGHRIAEFLEAARRLGAGGPIWAFVGGGAKRSEVEQARRDHPGARIEALPYTPEAALGASLRSADVHLVSLAREWQGLIVPSKLPAAFSVGRPVIFVGPVECEVARWVRESGGGWVIAEDDVSALLQAVDSARDAGERRRRGTAAAEFGWRHFDRARNRRRIADLFEGAALTGPNVPPRARPPAA
jgi:colanic acid biosynthesis glycosyl transferase WcaI